MHYAREAILCLAIGELLEKLKTDQLQPLEVLQAYQAKALSVNKEINAVCDFILEATEQAEALATLPPEERGPLYGLPISVKVRLWNQTVIFFKECFLLAGYDSTIGMGGLIGMKSAKDCPVIDMLKAQVCIGGNPFNACLLVQGALPFCLTNIPQTMVSCKHLGWSLHLVSGQLWLQQPRLW